MSNVPDFDSGKGYHWMKMTRQAQDAGTLDQMPRKPRVGKKTTDYFKQVDRKLSQRVFTVNISFDEHGHRIHDDEEE